MYFADFSYFNLTESFCELLTSTFPSYFKDKYMVLKRMEFSQILKPEVYLFQKPWKWITIETPQYCYHAALKINGTDSIPDQ